MEDATRPAKARGSLDARRCDHRALCRSRHDRRAAVNATRAHSPPQLAARYRASDAHRTVRHPPAPPRPRLPFYLRPRRRRAPHVAVGGFHRHRFLLQRYLRVSCLNIRSYSMYIDKLFLCVGIDQISRKLRYLGLSHFQKCTILANFSQPNRCRKRLSAAPTSSLADVLNAGAFWELIHVLRSRIGGSGTLIGLLYIRIHFVGISVGVSAYIPTLATDY